jgi:uncharacterized protein (DUF2141 family)
MRHALLLSALGALAALTASAQTATADIETVPEPEFAQVIYRLDAGRLVPLERQFPTNTRTKTSGFLVFNSQSAWEFAGAKSAVRFASGAALEFVVRPPSDRHDPAMMYHLRKLDSKRQTRELVLFKMHSSPFGTSMSQTGPGELPLTFTRYGWASIKITVAELQPGEYAFQVRQFQTLFCFGMD